jgi:hypothetical protein
MNHLVTEKPARLVEVGDLVMTPTGPREILTKTRHSRTGRLLFTYGLDRRQIDKWSNFGRHDDEPVFTVADTLLDDGREGDDR